VLSGVGAHQAETIPNPAGRNPPEIRVTYLRVVAIARQYQGASLPTGERLSTFVLNALIHDAVALLNREPLVVCYAAAENTRSRRLCTRLGFRGRSDTRDAPERGARPPGTLRLAVRTVQSSRPHDLIRVGTIRILDAPASATG
jgi:hypothetical protein